MTRTLRNTNFTEDRDFSVAEIYETKAPVKTEEQIDAEASALAESFMHDYFSGKDKSCKAEVEIKEAQCSDEVLKQLQNLIAVSQSTDSTALSRRYAEAVWAYTKAFKKQLSHQMRFFLENPE